MSGEVQADTAALLRAAQREFASDTTRLKQRVDTAAEALFQRSRQLAKELKQFSTLEEAVRRKLATTEANVRKLQAALAALGDVSSALDELGTAIAEVARRLAPRVSLLSR